MIGVQDLKHHVVDAVLVLLLEVGLGVKLCHGPHQRSGSRGGEHRLIVEHAACAGDGVVTGITPLIALAVQAARRADRAVYNEIVFDQRQVFIGVQLDQLCKAGWVRDHILLRLGVADGSQFLQDRERALGRLQFIEAVIVEGFLHEVGLLLILIGIQGGGQHGLKSEAVVDLLLRLFLRIAELDQHLVRKLRQRVLFDCAVVGQLFILGRIPEKKAGIRHGEHIFGGILQIRRGPGVKERGKFVLIAGIHEVRAQLVDGTDGLQRRDPLLERRSAQGIAAVPVHHQLEQVVGQTLVVSLRRVAEEHVFDVFHLFQVHVHQGAAEGVALRDFQREDLIPVYRKGKVVLHFGSRFLGHDAVQIAADPGRAA